MSIVNKVVDYVYGELSNIKEGELFVSLKRVKPLDQLDILHNLQKLGFKTKSYDLATDTWQVIKNKVSNHEEAVKQGYNESLDRYNTALEKYKLLRAEPNMTPSKFIALLKPKQFDSAFDRFCESVGLDTSVLDKTGHVTSVADAESELDAVRLAEGIPLGEMTATSQPDMTKLMSLIHESIMKEDSALEVSDITQSKVKRLKELGYTVTGNPPSSYIISGW